LEELRIPKSPFEINGPLTRKPKNIKANFQEIKCEKLTLSIITNETK
jgi:hypothetical protein